MGLILMAAKTGTIDQMVAKSVPHIIMVMVIHGGMEATHGLTLQVLPQVALALQQHLQPNIREDVVLECWTTARAWTPHWTSLTTISS